MSRIPVSLDNAHDTYVNANLAGKNYGPSTRIRVGNVAQERLGLIWFAPPPRGVTILTATLRLYEDNAASGSRTLTLKRPTESWKAGSTTYTNRPAVTTTNQVQVTKTAAGDALLWEFDVRTPLQAAADAPGHWFGWQMSSNEAAIRSFYSAQAAQFKPVLEYTYTERPDKPTDLNPDGNVSVPVSRPVLRFDFTDTAGSTEMAAYQVQANPTDVWTAPAYDSGTVASDTPEHDLALSTFTALTAGQSRFWRSRVQDESGEWSLWSNSAQFTYTPKPTLTLDNPGVGGVIEERTPPVFWTFAGQVAYQVIIRDAEGVELHNTGRVKSTANSYTIPARNDDGAVIIANIDDDTYTLVLRVWDGVERDTVRSGGTPYQQVTRTLTFNRDATVDPVTSVTVTELATVPGLQVEWDSTIAPDYFVVDRKIGDGKWKTIHPDLEPVDAFVSGSTYRIRDRRTEPRKETRYRIEAVRTSGGTRKTSNPVISAPFTLTPIGIWLIDEDRDIYVQLLDADEGTWTMGEEAETHLPAGSDRAVRVTQALRGYEGSIGGLLMSRTGRTVTQAEADVYDLKRTPGQTYVLMLSDLTIPVVVGNVTAAPTPHAETIRRVTFDFWQVADLPFKARV